MGDSYFIRTKTLESPVVDTDGNVVVPGGKDRVEEGLTERLVPIQSLNFFSVSPIIARQRDHSQRSHCGGRGHSLCSAVHHLGVPPHPVVLPLRCVGRAGPVPRRLHRRGPVLAAQQILHPGSQHDVHRGGSHHHRLQRQRHNRPSSTVSGRTQSRESAAASRQRSTPASWRPWAAP